MSGILLYSWPVVLIAIVFGVVCLSSITFVITRRRFHADVLKHNHDFAGFVFGTLGVLYSVFLGFTIINAQERFYDVSNQVKKEAHYCADLYRVSMHYPVEIKNTMHEGILNYMKSVIDDEWPLMGDNKESSKTLETLELMWKPYLAYTPMSDGDKIWFSETLRLLFDLNSARLGRIYSNFDSLSLLSWLALIIGGILIQSLLFFFGTQNPRAQLLINGLFVGYLAFMIYIVYSLDNPYQKPNYVSPKAFEVIYDYYIDRFNHS